MNKKVRFRFTVEKLELAFIKEHHLKLFSAIKSNNILRFIITAFVFIITTITIRDLFYGHLIIEELGIEIHADKSDDYLTRSIEARILKQTENTNVLGEVTNKDTSQLSTDVGYADHRVLTLEDFFRAYESPLEPYSEKFIEVSDKYKIKNWQLLPAIALAETRGCQTGISHEQRNCWGWGGSEPNRVWFRNYDDAIETISRRMINGYGNERMNAKDIQSTYCGQTCMEWGWRWAIGVDYYTRKINDFGMKYGLKRTNELTF